eukprot:COSAG03_NODE_159_length_11381_cov_85.480057_5_plen_82_part_00
MLNPAVVVNVNVHNRRTLPEVKVQFIDGNTQEYSGGMTGVQIIDQIEQTTSKMMLDKLLSRCGLSPTRVACLTLRSTEPPS